jgi:hypothetical protein
MKVKELINELQKLNGENECVLFDDSYNNEKSFRFLSMKLWLLLDMILIWM